MKSNFGYYLKTSLVLLLICAICGGVVATVQKFTAPAIAQNDEKEIQDALHLIFPEVDSYDCVEKEAGSEMIETLYLLRGKNGGKAAGYAAIASAKGFKDSIRLCIGVNPDGSLIGVRVLSNSETPGLGSKACEESYLADYEGLSGTISFGGGVDAVSGATISSRAILDCVNTVLAEIAAEGGAA